MKQNASKNGFSLLLFLYKKRKRWTIRKKNGAKNVSRSKISLKVSNWMIISDIWRHVVTTKTRKGQWAFDLMYLTSLTHSSTQWRKSINSSLQVSLVHGLPFTRSLHSCKRCLTFSHAWSSAHNSFNFANGSWERRAKFACFYCGVRSRTVSPMPFISFSIRASLKWCLCPPTPMMISEGKLFSIFYLQKKKNAIRS